MKTMLEKWKELLADSKIPFEECEDDYGIFLVVEGGKHPRSGGRAGTYTTFFFSKNGVFHFMGPDPLGLARARPSDSKKVN